MPSADTVMSGTQFVMGVKPQGPSPTLGVSNPYGIGASAYEPNTEIWDPTRHPLDRGSSMQLSGYDAVDKAAEDQAASDLAAKQSADAQAAAQAAAGGGQPVANGSVLSFINAAKTMLGKPYVWGGTTASGTDCSGLLYYAFNQAGIKMPRYRASDYGKMGQQVDAEHALPGDIVYWDEGGGTDHVGIYLGNGLVLNSPHSGTVTQINHVWGNPTYRRIISDSGFGQMTLPNGGTQLSYAGSPAGDLFTGRTIVGGTPSGSSKGRFRPI